MRNLYEQFKDLSMDDLNQNLCNACDDGDLEVVKFLLTSPKLEKHADIHYKNDRAFGNACYYGHLGVVKYLTTSPELKEKININNISEVPFELACRGRNLNIIEYLILDLNIEKTPNIQRFLDLMSNNNSAADKAQKMFEIRELNEKLETKLQPNGKAISKKYKL